MSQISVAKYISDGDAVYLPFGFVPDFALVANFGAATATVFYYWWKMMDDLEATGYQEGISVTEGVTGTLADAGGLQPYDTSSDAPTVSVWSASSTPTARTSTAAGTYVHPTRANSQGMDYSAVFECVTAGTGAATEPTWPKDPSGQVTDGTNVWERVDGECIKARRGYKGLAMAGGIETDSCLMYVLAIQADQSWNWGDVVGWTSGICPDV
jgi:hypothetical protein